MSNGDITGPAYGVFNVTPSDTVDLLKSSRAIRVTIGGAVKITGADGVTTVCDFIGGETRPLRATRIWATGTTATGIEGMY